MIQVEQTPNPDSLKFLSQKILSRVGTEEFKKSNLNKIKIPFVKEVLNFSGVELVLISDNFLTVKKEKNASWDSLKPMLVLLKDASINNDIQKIRALLNQIVPEFNPKH